MYTVLLVVHVILVLALIITVLLQRSEGGALGMGGGGGGGGGFLSGRAQGNLLTRATAVLGAMFMVSSIVLTVMVTRQDSRASIVEQIQSAPVEEIPAEPEGPSVPIAD